MFQELNRIEMKIIRIVHSKSRRVRAVLILQMLMIFFSVFKCMLICNSVMEQEKKICSEGVYFFHCSTQLSFSQSDKENVERC